MRSKMTTGIDDREFTIKKLDSIPIAQSTRCTCYLKLFILVKRSTCFGRSFRPSSGAQDCVYSNRHMSNNYCYLLLSGMR